MASLKVQLPFDMLTALSKAEGPFDRLTVLSKVEGLRCAASFVIAAYCKSTPHSSGFARLEFGALYFAIEF